MVRCIPIFLVLSCLSSISFNHPINNDGSEVAGIQAFDDEIEEIAAIQVIEDGGIIDIQSFYIVDESTESVGIQAFDDIEDQPTETGLIEIRSFEDDIISIETDSETIDEPTETIVNNVADSAVIAQPTEAIPEFQFEMVEAFEKRINNKVNNLKIRSNRTIFKSRNFRSKHKTRSESEGEDSNESEDNSILIKPETPYVITEAPEEEPTEIPELINSFITPDDEPTDFIENATDNEEPTAVFEKRQVKNEEVGIALFEVENENSVSDAFETVTEVVTDVHVVSAEIDEEGPTIGGVIDEPEDEDVPMFGVIEDAGIDEDDIVEIALVNKRDEVIEENDEGEGEKPTEAVVISNILIDLSDEQEYDYVSETVTESIFEEPNKK
jgi:hypothetical protein